MNVYVQLTILAILGNLSSEGSLNRSSSEVISH